MQPLFRPEFRPKLWSAADLDAAADHWLWLFDQAPATAGRDADHRTELRLRGVPNDERDAVTAELAERFPSAEVTRPDPDTLTAVGPALDFQAAPMAGLGVPRLASSPFDGLYLEVRFTATARKRNGTPHAAGTLVLAGELGSEGFTVYVTWAEGNSDAANQLAREVPWADEQAWRSDAENFWANLAVAATSRPLAKKLFPKPAGRFGRAWLWLAQFPFTGERRGARFAAKFVANLGLIAAMALAVDSLPTIDTVFAVLKAIILFQSAIPLGLLLFQFGYAWVMVHRITRAIYVAYYSSRLSLVAADEATVASYFGNPFGRQSGADWGAVGCRPLGEARHENPHLQHLALRLLATADGTANVLLISIKSLPNPDGTVRSHSWPPQVVAKVISRYPDDATVVTANDYGTAYRRRIAGIEGYLLSVFPTLTDPRELLARHAESCRLHAVRTGHAPLPSMKFLDFERWDAERLEEERRLYAHNPVTWSDTFVLILGYVRRAYR